MLCSWLEPLSPEVLHKILCAGAVADVRADLAALAAQASLTCVLFCSLFLLLETFICAGYGPPIEG